MAQKPSTEAQQPITELDGLETYDASLDPATRTLYVDGERYALGLCTDYEEWFGGDVKHTTYRNGPYSVKIKVDHRLENGTLVKVNIEE